MDVKYSPGRKWLALGAAIIGGMIGMQLLIHYGRSSLPLLTIGTAVLMLAIFALSTLAYFYSDETQRSAQKDAWYWGASAGLLVVGVVLVVLTHAPFLMLSDFELPILLGGLHRRAASLAYFAEGMIFTMLAQLAGFVVAWCAWHMWPGKR